MMQNRSVPTDSVLPHLAYRDVAKALAWLAMAFGFAEHYHYGAPDSPIQGAQMHLGPAWIMLEAARAGRASPAQLGGRSQYLTVFIADVDAHYARAVSAGAEIMEGLNETVYGERQYVASDLDGHHWLFSQHVRDVSPTEWGAITSNDSDAPRAGVQDRQ